MGAKATMATLVLLAPMIFSLLAALPAQGGAGETVSVPLEVAAQMGYGLGEPQCGRQAGGKLCPNGLCCSQWGFCGDQLAWCGPGCQSNCDYYHRCGARHNGRVCPDGRCCSQFDWCGDSAPWCGAGCQPEYGVCWNLQGLESFMPLLKAMLPRNATATAAAILL